jgi:hypothetical protein
MKLAAERNLIYAYTPMDIHNPHKKKFPLPFNEGQTTVSGEYWGAEEQMLIDVLGDILRISAYKNAKPQIIALKRFISTFDKDMVDTYFADNDVSKCMPVEYPLMLYPVKVDYPFLKKYTSKTFYGLMERVSKIKLLCKYRYKINNIERNYDFDKRKDLITEKMNKFEFLPNGPQNLFSFEYDKDRDRYKILFDTGLGRLFANNILAAEWEWLPFEFYQLSKNTQNLYRKFMLVKKKNTEIKLMDLELARVLKLQSLNRTARNKSIKRLLKELAENGYIEWRIEKGYTDPVYSIRKLVSN